MIIRATIQRLLHIFQDPEKVIVIGNVVNVVAVDIFYDALLVDNKNHPIAESVIGEDIIFLRHFAVRPEIRQERIGDAA